MIKKVKKDFAKTFHITYALLGITMLIMKNLVILVAAWTIICVIGSHKVKAQTYFKAGSGVYQFTNYDPNLAQGLSFEIGYQFNSQKIPRLSLITGIGYDYFAGNSGNGPFYTLTTGSGMSLTAGLSFAIIQQEKFEWRINSGTFLSHYQINFQNYTETFNEPGNRNRSFGDINQEVGSALGYSLSTSLLFKLNNGKWIFFNPFEWQIGPDGFAHLTASVGLRF